VEGSKVPYVVAEGRFDGLVTDEKSVFAPLEARVIKTVGFARE